MTGITVRRRVPFANVATPPALQTDRLPRGRPVSRAARLLGLAHHVEQLVGAGTIPDYATAAHDLGITRARMTQLMGLLLLAPVIQERILSGDLPWSERRLRRLVREPSWARQVDHIRDTPAGARG